jgi:hypothetical protein
MDYIKRLVEWVPKKLLPLGAKAKDIPKSDAFETIVSFLLVLVAGGVEKVKFWIGPQWVVIRPVRHGVSKGVVILP